MAVALADQHPATLVSRQWGQLRMARERNVAMSKGQTHGRTTFGRMLASSKMQEGLGVADGDAVHGVDDLLFGDCVQK